MKTRESIGGFLIERSLAVGGMGEIFLAVDPGSGKRVAIKTVQAENSGQMLSLRREIRALLSMSHPSLVSIVDHGLNDPVPWFAMEYIEGVSLRESFELSYETQVVSDEIVQASGVQDTLEYVGDGPPQSAWKPQRLPPEEQRRLIGAIAEICRGLGHMHGHGLVHQDLKPENIIIRKDSGRPVLVDFGIASRSASGNREHLTRVGAVAGTPAYMAPEQARNLWTDGRADLYAIGCVLFEIVMGHPPFYEGTPFEILSSHAFREPPPLAEDVDPDLRELIESLLEKEPQDRPGFADLVAHRLHQILEIPEPTDLPDNPIYVHRPAFVGRGETMALCDQKIQELKDGRGSTTVISGPPGSGKTRFATELMHRVERDPDVEGFLVEVGATHEGVVQFQAVLSEIADRCREGGPEFTKRILGKEGAALGILYPRLMQLPGMESFEIPPPLPVQLEVVRRTEAWTQIVLRLSGGRPIAIVLDQILPPLIRYLVMLRREIEHYDLPIALFVTSGPDAGRFKDLSAGEIIGLEPLSDEALDTVIRTMLSVEHAPEALRDFLIERSRGLPAMVAEYLTYATERGLIHRDPVDGWRLNVDREELAEMGLPERLGGVLAERVRSLPDESAKLLLWISVFGAEIPIPRLASMVEDPRQLEGLDILFKRGFLTTRGERIALSENQLRTAVIELAAEDDLREAHAQIAETKLEAYETSSVLEIADHLEASGQRERALDLLFETGETMDGRFTEESYRLFSAFVQLDPPRDQRTLTVILRMSQIGVMTGRAARVIESARQGLELARELHNEYARMTLVTILAFGLSLRGDRDEARELAKNGIKRAVASGAEGPVGLGYYALGTTEMLDENFEEAYEYLDAAREGIMAHYGEGRQAAILHVNLTHCLLRLYRIEEALETLEVAESIAKASNQRDLHAYVYGNRGSLLYVFEDRDEEALGLLSKAIEVHRECRDRYGEANARIARAQLKFMTGDPSSAARDAEKAMGLFAIVDDHVEATRATAVYSFAMAACGEVETATTVLPRCFDRAPDNVGLKLDVLGYLVRMYRRLGEFEEARRWLEIAGPFVERTDDPLEYIYIAAESIFVDLADGKESKRDLRETMSEVQLAHRHARIELAALDAAQSGKVELFRGEPRRRYALEWPGHSRS